MKTDASLRSLAPALASAFLFACAHTCMAVSYAVPGAVYSQNFDSLPTDAPNNASLQGTNPGQYLNGWRDDSTTIPATQISLPGWHLYHPLGTGAELGFNGHQRLRMGSGANTGSFWGFGSSSADSEKSLGSIGSTTIAANNENMYMALRLVNDTGMTLTDFTVTYDGEQWRDGQSPDPETLVFGYSLTADISDWFSTATFTEVASLNFAAPVFSGTATSGTAVNGNAEGKIAGITGTISGIVWAPGTELWLRWADPQLPSFADDGLSIDNLQFSAVAVPEPCSAGLLGLGIVAWVVSRRSRI